jgi:hypothetical protein
MRGIFIAAIAIGLSSSQASAESASFTFMGHAIGDPISKWAKQLDIGDGLGCKKADVYGRKHCRDISLKRGKYGYEIGPLPVDWLYWDFLDDKLIGFQVAANVNDFRTMLDMTTEKYGQPSKLTETRATWKTPHGPMQLYAQYVGARPYAFLELQDSDAVATISERDRKLREQAVNAGKKAF